MNPLDTDTEFEPNDDTSTTLLDPLGVLERRWKLMLAALVVGVLATLGAISRIEPRYEAEATVLVAPQKISEKIVEPTIQEDALTRIEASAALVLSRSNLARMVEEFDLYPKLRNVETMGEIVGRVRADVSIRPVETTQSGERLTARVYSIGFVADEPAAAAGVANALATLFVDTSFQERHRQHEVTTEFLRRELVRAEQELREQNRTVKELKQRSRGRLPSDLQANLARLDLLQRQRQSLALQIAESGTRIATLASDDVLSPDAKLTTLREELARLRATSTGRHPDVSRVQREIQEIEQELALSGPSPQDHSPRGRMRAAEQTVAVLRGQLAATERELATLDASIGGMPAVQEELGSLEEKAAILRENYLDFLRKLQDAELDESLLNAQQGERVSVLNPAEPPSRTSLVRWKYLAFGLVASLGLALTVGVALEFADPVVVTPEQMTRLTGLPTLGWVARIR